MRARFLAKLSTWVLCVLMFLSACSERVTNERYGRFIVATHLTVDKLKWEGSNTRLKYTEVCRDDGTMCFRGDIDLEYGYSRRYQRLLVNSDKVIKLYNTESGEEIKCNFDSLRGRLKTGSSASWSSIAMILGSSRDEDGINRTKVRYDVYNMEKGCRLVKSEEQPVEKAVFGSQNDAGEIAWIYCTTNDCTLAWMSADFLSVKRKNIGCSEQHDLELEWVNGVPEPRNSSVEFGSICLDNDGKLKYPRAQPRKPGPQDGTPDQRF
jgi:hypothetical protein